MKPKLQKTHGMKPKLQKTHGKEMNTMYNTHYYGANRVVSTESLRINFTVKHTQIGGALMETLVPTRFIGAGLSGYRS